MRLTFNKAIFLLHTQQQQYNSGIKPNNGDFHSQIDHNNPALGKNAPIKSALTRGMTNNKLVCFIVTCLTWENSNICTTMSILLYEQLFKFICDFAINWLLTMLFNMSSCLLSDLNPLSNMVQMCHALHVPIIYNMSNLSTCLYQVVVICICCKAKYFWW